MIRGILLGALLVAAIAANCVAERVSFPDAGLETAVREAIGRASGDINTSQLEDLETLDASAREIANLEGIQYCTNLIELRLMDNVVVDLDPLSDLTSLLTLDLSGNQIVDLTPLSKLIQLTTLRAGNNRIIELEPLAALALVNPQDGGLRSLELEGNNISNLSALGELVSLQKLVLHNNQIRDISSLSTLTNLASLSLRDNQITDIGALASLRRLKILVLDNNQIADITVLAKLEDLLGLWLTGNPIVNLQPLVDNPGLDFGDRIYICSDQLDASLAAQHILALSRRGVYVYEFW